MGEKYFLKPLYLDTNADWDSYILYIVFLHEHHSATKISIVRTLTFISYYHINLGVVTIGNGNAIVCPVLTDPPLLSPNPFNLACIAVISNEQQRMKFGISMFLLFNFKHHFLS